MNYVRIGLLLLITYLLSSHSLVKDSYLVDLTTQSSTLVAEIIPERPEPFTRFFVVMGKLESNNNYSVINRFGYMGKYQFSKRTLRTLRSSGYLDITEREIVSYTSLYELQERSMRALTYHNLDVLRRYGLLGYVGSTVGGVTITLNGMLAGSHLVGPRAVRDYIRSNGRIIARDGNRTTVVHYLKQFES